MFNAMGASALVIGSRTPPVEEVIEKMSDRDGFVRLVIGRLLSNVCCRSAVMMIALISHPSHSSGQGLISLDLPYFTPGPHGWVDAELVTSTGTVVDLGNRHRKAFFENDFFKMIISITGPALTCSRGGAKPCFRVDGPVTFELGKSLEGFDQTQLSATTVEIPVYNFKVSIRASCLGYSGYDPRELRKFSFEECLPLSPDEAGRDQIWGIFSGVYFYTERTASFANCDNLEILPDGTCQSLRNATLGELDTQSALPLRIPSKWSYDRNPNFGLYVWPNRLPMSENGIPPYATCGGPDLRCTFGYFLYPHIWVHMIIVNRSFSPPSVSQIGDVGLSIISRLRANIQPLGGSKE